MGKVLLAALVGGILEFGWGAFAHVVLHLEDRNFKALPNEAALLDAAKANKPPAGMYWYPFIDMNKTPSDADKKAWLDRTKQSGMGLVVVMPDDAAGFEPPPANLVSEFATNVLGALILASFACALVACRGVARTGGLGALLGLFAWASQDASNWIWYHFTTSYAMDALFDAVIGWTIAGIGIALVLRKKAAAPAA